MEPASLSPHISQCFVTKLCRSASVLCAIAVVTLVKYAD